MKVKEYENEVNEIIRRHNEYKDYESSHGRTDDLLFSFLNDIMQGSLTRPSIISIAKELLRLEDLERWYA